MAKPTEDYDYIVYRGDTSIIKLDFFDLNKLPINLSSYNLKFSVRDEFNNVDEVIQKDRTGGTPNGIFILSDNQSSVYNITASNQLAILIDSADAVDLIPGVYPFDIEFSTVDNIYTPIRGNLIIRKDMTING